MVVLSTWTPDLARSLFLDAIDQRSRSIRRRDDGREMGPLDPFVVCERDRRLVARSRREQEPILKRYESTERPTRRSRGGRLQVARPHRRRQTPNHSFRDLAAMRPKTARLASP